MSNNNIQSLLDNIHETVAKELLDRLQMGTATTADISAAIKLLKDNNITSEVAESEPLREIKKFPFPVNTEAEA